jgi:ketosteroid isomerase-like protein
MTSRNVEIVRRAYESFNRDGAEGTLPFLHDHVEWDESRLPARNPGIYRGHEGVRRLGRQNAELWRDISVEVDDVFEAAEDRVVAVVRVRGRGKFTGEEVELPMTQVWELSGGRALTVRLYLDRQEALDAAGSARTQAD